MLVEFADLFLFTVFLPCQDILGVGLCDGVLYSLTVTLVDDLFLGGQGVGLYLAAGDYVELLACGVVELLGAGLSYGSALVVEFPGINFRCYGLAFLEFTSPLWIL